MEHISEKELMEYVAGRLDGPRRQEIAEHIEACEACSKLCREAGQMWDELGQWEVDTAGRDVAGRVLELAAKADSLQEQCKTRSAARVRVLSIALRTAASIIIAIGLGHKLGEYSVTGSMASESTSANRPEYVAAFGLEWSSDLAWLILEDEHADEGEQG